MSLEIAEAMVEEFEDYLLEDSLYRQLRIATSAGDRMPNMSAGSLLETLQDLQFAAESGRLTSTQADHVDELVDRFERLKTRHTVRYHEKLAWELKSQIDSWRWFLQDCQDKLSWCRDEYPFEVRLRNRIALLIDELGDAAPADQLARLQALDQDLREVFATDGFLLDDYLRDRYPENRYWWLYGQIQD